jgi:hypothetical protein
MLMARTLVGCLALIAFGSAAAQARIVCREGYQVVNGQEISTPYCNDNYVARVAREHGFKASNETVRNSPSLKNEICRKFGSDIRIREYCDIDDGPDQSR